MFKDYTSKPTIRKAYKVEENDIITKVDESTSSIQVISQIATEQYYDVVQFKHYGDVKVGDYIVYLTREDIYHCSAKVFADRNIVE